MPDTQILDRESQGEMERIIASLPAKIRYAERIGADRVAVYFHSYDFCDDNIDLDLLVARLKAMNLNAYQEEEIMPNFIVDELEPVGVKVYIKIGPSLEDMFTRE